MKTVIRSNSSGKLNISELLAYKDLFVVLAFRDLRVRYAQTFLGLAWALIQPVVTLLIFTLIFGRAIKVDTGSIPYPVFALCGLCAWSYFSFVMSQSGNSIIAAGEMVKKIFFPRLIIPLSKSMVALVDLVIALLFLVVLMIVYNITPTVKMILLPFGIIINIIISLGVGIWLSALTIRYRDFQHIVPFAVQIGVYLSPIAYPVSLVPAQYQLLYHLNPVVGIVEIFRFILLENSQIQLLTWLSLGVGIVIFLSGIVYFKKVERVMADLV